MQLLDLKQSTNSPSSALSERAFGEEFAVQPESRVLGLLQELPGYPYEFCFSKCFTKFLSFHCPSETAGWTGKNFKCIDQDLFRKPNTFSSLSFFFVKDFFSLIITSCSVVGVPRRCQIQVDLEPETLYPAEVEGQVPALAA